MLTCSKCKKEKIEDSVVRGSGWCSVLHEERGSIPKVICPKCADLYQSGWITRVDPETGKSERVQVAHKATMSRF